MAIDPQSEFQAKAPSLFMQPKPSNLIPYVVLDDGPILPDAFLAGVFYQMEADGLVDVVFHSGKTKDAAAFIRMVKNPANLFTFAINSKGECLMVAWLNSIGHNHAFGHFCYFHSVDGPDAITVGKQIIDSWWALNSGGAELDVILGMLPAFNGKAIHYAGKLGFVEAGRVPRLFRTTSGVSDSVLLYLLRPTYG